ncbi:hypothetical protein BDD12DRAFT_116191 [Trichophaea hybrida]|nr:hypothetical protein BDD12DRAFT_116191 [Trichophaea hybrida]
MSSTVPVSPTSPSSPTPCIALRPPMNIADDATPRVQMPGHNEFVKLCHPGYAFGSSVMLQLRPIDSLATVPSTTTTITDLAEATAALSLHGTGNTRFGLHYNTAATACYIIAANRPGVLFSQLFTQSQFAAHVQSHPECLAPNLDQLLTNKWYWFYPLDWEKDPKPRYPVCPDFRSWAFPHQHFPTLEPWNHSNVPLDEEIREYNVAPSAASASVKSRDKRCKISDYADALESAHLIPREESIWYKSNRMGQYADNPVSTTNPTTDVANLIALRDDLHSIFDQRFFVLVPKGSAFHVHFLVLTKDLGPIYHNREVRGLTSVVSPEFIFARFAWAIFRYDPGFATSHTAITVWNEVTEEWQEQTKDGKEWHDYQVHNPKNTRAEGKEKGKAKTGGDKTSDHDSSYHADSGSQLRDDSPYHSPLISPLASPPTSLWLGTSWSAGAPDPVTGASTAAISQETLAEIIRLSRIHPQAMSYLSDHHCEELAVATREFTVLSRHIRARNIPKREIRHPQGPREWYLGCELMSLIKQAYREMARSGSTDCWSLESGTGCPGDVVDDAYGGDLSCDRLQQGTSSAL